MIKSRKWFKLFMVYLLCIVVRIQTRRQVYRGIVLRVLHLQVWHHQVIIKRNQKRRKLQTFIGLQENPDHLNGSKELWMKLLKWIIKYIYMFIVIIKDQLPFDSLANFYNYITGSN